MGKGGYNGGSSIIHAAVGYISTPSKNARARATTGKKPKIKRVVPSFSGHMTLEEARHAGLSREQWQKQANSHVSRIERQIAETRKKLTALTNELKLAEQARQAAFQVKAAPQRLALPATRKRGAE